MFKLIVAVLVLCQMIFFIQADSSKGSRLSQEDINLDDLSDEEMSLLMDIINRKKTLEKSKTGKCHFQQSEKSIIRTTESLHNGATFLNASSAANSTEKCEKSCCELSECDFAVFQTPTGDEKTSLCYLFSCTVDGEFVCTTAEHGNYAVFRRDRKVEQESDLLDVANEAMVPHDPSTADEEAKSLATDLNLVTSTNSTAGITTTTAKPSTTTSITTTSSTVTITRTTTTKPTTTTTTTTKKLVEVQGSQTCVLEVDIGKCDGETDRYYFNLLTNACEKFKYSGCGGNANNFETIEFCEKQCDEYFTELTETDESVILPLALGLIVTASVLFMVACRLRVMKKKLKRRGKPISVDESDYLINGMYL